MSALGDSTSTATLAQYHRSRAMHPLTHLQALPEFIRFGLRGGNKFSLSDWKLSWTTGIGSAKVWSHAARLKNINPKLSISNFAEPGANVESVRTQQLPKLNAWSQMNFKRNYPDYVTLLVGANDICADSLEDATPVKSYLNSYGKILNEILKQAPTTRILVVALAPYDQLRNSDDAFLAAFPKMQSCADFWQMAPLCKSITHGNDSNTHKVKIRVNTLNAGLRNLVNTLQKKFGDRVRFADKIAKRSIQPQDLSIDCFHPNDIGQKDIAEFSWRSTWWANR